MEKNRELIDRYIYQVVRRVKKDQREEIRLELEELIDDMSEADSLENVLEKLGPPDLFARKYREEERYVVGPEYFDTYEWVLKIVLISVLASVVLSAVVKGITGETWGKEAAYGVNQVVNRWADMGRNVVTDVMIDGIGGLIGAFGCVTLLFAIMERQHLKVSLKKKEVWKPENLEPVPDKKAMISRGESVVSIVFAVVFMGLFIFAPHLFGAYVFEDKEFIRTIPLFNMDQWTLILPFLLASLLLGFIEDLVKLVKGCYCKAVLVSSCITGVLQVVIAVMILRVLPFWNPEFLDEAKKEFHIRAFSRGDIFSAYGTETFSNIILAFILIIICFDLGITVFRTLRYGKEN